MAEARWALVTRPRQEVPGDLVGGMGILGCFRNLLEIPVLEYLTAPR